LFNISCLISVAVYAGNVIIESNVNSYTELSGAMFITLAAPGLSSHLLPLC